MLDDAALIASELVGNALRHARPLPEGGVSVRWELTDDSVRLEVTDGGGDTEPRLGAAGAVERQLAIMTTGGRGLSIVEALSDSWGVRRRPDATTVWARLARRRRPSRGRREG